MDRDDERLAWFLFLKMDSVPVGELTPQTIAGFLDEFWETPPKKVLERLREEYRAEEADDFRKIRHCIALLNSMVRGGELHSDTSARMTIEALEALERMEQLEKNVND